LKNFCLKLNSPRRISEEIIEEEEVSEEVLEVVLEAEVAVDLEEVVKQFKLVMVENLFVYI